MNAGENVFLAATDWIQSVVLGPVGISIAVMAIASVGLLMLSGRLNLKRGATVVLGCFILFGASSIARGLHDLTGARSSPPAMASADATALEASLSTTPTGTEDPYAGAALRR